MKRLVSTLSNFVGKTLVKLRLINQIFYGALFLLGASLIIAWMFLGLASLSDFIFKLIKINLLFFCLTEIILFGLFLFLKYWEIKQDLNTIKKINYLTVNDSWNKKLFNSKNILTVDNPNKKIWKAYLHPLAEEETLAFGIRRLQTEIIRKIMGLGECFLISKMLFIIENGGHFFIFLGFLGGTLTLTIIKGFMSSAELAKKDF